jgi:hypothetical protein
LSECGSIDKASPWLPTRKVTAEADAADKASAVASVATRGLSLKAMEVSLLNELIEPE